MKKHAFIAAAIPAKAGLAVIAAGFMSLSSTKGQNAVPQFEGGENEIRLSDQFSTSQSESGGNLDGRAVGESKVVWESTPNTVVLKNETGEGVGTSKPMNVIGRIGVPSDATVIEVESNVILTPAEAGKNWAAVGIGGGMLGNPTFGGLYFLLDSEGRYILIFNKKPADTTSSDIENLAIGPLTSFNPGGVNTLRLEIDKSRNVISAWANDQLVTKDLSMTDKNIEFETSYVGFSAIQQAPGTPVVDSISFRFSK